MLGSDTSMDLGYNQAPPMYANTELISVLIGNTDLRRKLEKYGMRTIGDLYDCRPNLRNLLGSSDANTIDKLLSYNMTNGCPA
jgi:hypothetical protein